MKSSRTMHGKAITTFTPSRTAPTPLIAGIRRPEGHDGIQPRAKPWVAAATRVVSPNGARERRRRIMGALIALTTLLCLAPPIHASNPDAPTLIIAQGADGAPEYGKQFTEWRTRLAEAGQRGGAIVHILAPDAPGAPNADDLTTKDRLKSLLDAESKQTPHALWLVLIGHGTFDGREARFNLEGPDLTADELSQWLTPFERTVVLINCSSSSAPFLKLAGGDRIVITATKSGYELNFSRFGEYLSQAVAAPDADLDKDGQTSLLEAFLLASRRTSEFYESDRRLATEQALLDDNGDGLGTPAAFFRGVRAVKKPQDNAAADGLRAHQLHLVPSQRERDMPPQIREKRNALELAIAKLRDRKSEMEEDAYYAELEKLAVELAKLYDGLESP